MNINFRVLSLKDNIDIITRMYNDKNSKDEVVNLFSGINGNNIKDIVTIYYHNNINDINKSIINYKLIWNKYHNKYLNMLSSYFDIPCDINEINVYVGIIPVFERHIDTNSFNLIMNLSDNNLINFCAHEILHFMWFKKWITLYPDTKIEDCEYPSLIWKYSEMVTDPILNNKPFTELFNNLFIEHSYGYFYNYLDKNSNSMMDYLRDLYGSKIDINKKIITGYNYLKENINIL